MGIRDNITTAKLRLQRFNWVAAALITASVALGILYIWQVNITATRGFEILALNDDIEVARLENDRLDMNVAELRSISSVTTRMKMLGLTEISTIEYLTPGDGSVAINR